MVDEGSEDGKSTSDQSSVCTSLSQISTAILAAAMLSSLLSNSEVKGIYLVRLPSTQIESPTSSVGGPRTRAGWILRAGPSPPRPDLRPGFPSSFTTCFL